MQKINEYYWLYLKYCDGIEKMRIEASLVMFCGTIQGAFRGHFLFTIYRDEWYLVNEITKSNITHDIVP